MSTSWIAQVRNAGVVEVARRLELQVLDGGRHLAPCPVCRERTRSRRDTRPGPVFVTGRGAGWTCSRCSAKGSALELAMFVLLETAEKPGKGDPRWGLLRARCTGLGLCGTFAPRRSRAEWKPPPRQRIAAAELAALWERCGRADEDGDVAGWLVRRGLDPEVCARRDLVRALPTDRLPRWAHFRGAPWAMGWRAVLRAWDHQGQLASLRGRWVHAHEPPDGGEKAGAAAGGPGSAGGAVLACGLGRQVLEHGRRPQWLEPDGELCVVVTEGEPDWLTWASREDLERPPVVLGVFSGAWCDEIAQRIPDESRVVVRTHHDRNEAGDRYAKAIARTLYYRCAVLRSRGAHGAA
jgi:hypothetical protein